MRQLTFLEGKNGLGPRRARIALQRSARATLFVLAVGAGCGSGSSGGGLPLGTIQQTVGPAGAEISVTAAGNPEIAGTTLLIPANALAVETVITVSKNPGDEALPGETAVGPGVRFTPDGLTFKVPATLTLPYKPNLKPAGAGLAVAVHSGASRTEVAGAALTVDAAKGLLSLDISHFTAFQALGVPAPAGCVTNADCPNGQLCQNGACRASGCASNSDCPNGQVCQSGACKAAGTDGGTDGGQDGGTDGGPQDGGTDGPNDGP